MSLQMTYPTISWYSGIVDKEQRTGDQMLWAGEEEEEPGSKQGCQATLDGSCGGLAPKHGAASVREWCGKEWCRTDPKNVRSLKLLRVKRGYEDPQRALKRLTTWAAKTPLQIQAVSNFHGVQVLDMKVAIPRGKAPDERKATPWEKNRLLYQAVHSTIPLPLGKYLAKRVGGIWIPLQRITCKSGNCHFTGGDVQCNLHVSPFLDKALAKNGFGVMLWITFISANCTFIGCDLQHDPAWLFHS